MNTEMIERRFHEYGFDDYKWITGTDVIVKQWVRFKCVFACPGHGASAMCPPNMPSIDECRRFFSEYEAVAVLHDQKTPQSQEDDEALSPKAAEDLLALERQLFLDGNYKAMAIPMTVCSQCAECTGLLATCRHQDKARPTPEALGVDVFETVRRIGFPIEVLTDYTDTVDRYALLLIE